MEDTYLTLSTESEGLFKDRSSKFFYYSFPVSNEEEIKERLKELRKKHFDARHHCFAWNLGTDGMNYRANDDGEPNHSAGDPILGQIRSNNLTNCLIVVVRYFGGTKLGISGLINAYKTSAAMAIAENEIIEKLITTRISISFTYPALNEVMKLIKLHEFQIVNQELELTCKMILEVRKSLEDRIRESLEEIESLKLND
ncbi:MAG: YigZ family protein [Algoriphagus sp.]|uniref:IMPACT family protein n=1 Tax=Algoriphagus sp. TaxID=1872435 RepID=UPI00260DFADB|nr:YigZ family protein [Algoriphagus sp.]MDG1277444.1 YigZ family protein [Algoriphagus sp.]